MSIEAVEQTILSRIENDYQGALKKTGSLGGNWTLNTLKLALQMSPGVYVAFLGGSVGDYAAGSIKARFEVSLVNKAALEIKRREGTTGAYAMINGIAPLVHRLAVPEVGVLQMTGVNNLFKDALFNMGGSVYAIGLSIDLPLADSCIDDGSALLAQHLSFTAFDETVEVY